MWWPIISHLKNYLQTELAEVKVIIGSGESLDDFPIINLLRDIEEKLNLYRKKGICKLNLDCWIRNDESHEKGYQSLYELEEKVLLALTKWAEIVSDELEADLWLEVEDMLGDNDQFRPVLGSRTILLIKWTKYGL